MGLAVRRQVGGLRKVLAARLARVWALLGVRAHVHRQPAGVREGLTARLALVRVLLALGVPGLPLLARSPTPPSHLGGGIFPAALVVAGRRGGSARD